MIIFAVIMMFTVLTILLCLHISNRTGAKPNGNMLLGLTLPQEALKNEAVAQIIKSYCRANNRITFILLLLSVPFALIHYASFGLIYLVIWGGIAFALYGFGLTKYYDELHDLKQRNKWWVGDCRIISIDTEVSRLKDTFPISKLWYLLPLVIATLPFVFIFTNENTDITLWVFAVLGASVVFLAFILSRVFERERTVVYSDKSEVNLALNRLYKHEWSKCWLLIAIAHSSIITLLCWLIHNSTDAPAVLLIFTFMSVTCTLIPILLAYGKIRSERNRLLQNSGEDTYTDEDLYWHKGSYNNPNDSSWFVEKRIGIGMTLNMAKRGAKAIMVGIIGSSVLLVLGLGIYALPYDFGSMSIETNVNEVSIRAPFRNYNFSINDIESIALIDSFPHATRTNAVSTERILAGRFSVTGYGASSAFIHRNSTPIIVIELRNNRVFLNGETREETMEIYHQLIARSNAQ